MKYLYCQQLYNNLVFNDKGVSFCFGNSDRNEMPSIPYGKTPEETVEIIISLREEIHWESTENVQKELIKPCLKCRDAKLSDTPSDLPGLNYVSINHYPSPCQCACIYCKNDYPKDWFDYKKSADSHLTHHILSVIGELYRLGTVTDSTTFQCSFGEVTINPHKEEIYRFLADRCVRWFTNGFIYSPEIAENIKKFSGSQVFLSLDSGTKETYRKIKNRNKFADVVSNLTKYKKSGNVSLKYIVLPGVNDSIEDFTGFAEICRSLGIRFAEVVRDARNTYHTDAAESAALLAVILLKNGIQPTALKYSFMQNDVFNTVNAYINRDIYSQRIQDYLETCLG